jgi:hypothetical protein
LNKWDFIVYYHKNVENIKEKDEEKINWMLRTYFEESSEKKFYIGEEYVIKIKVNTGELQNENFKERFQSIAMVLEKEFKLLFQYFLRTCTNKIFEIYKEDKEVLIPKKFHLKEFSDEDFQEYFVTDEDFDFCKDFNENNNWSLASNFSTNANSYLSKSKSVKNTFKQSVLKMYLM